MINFINWNAQKDDNYKHYLAKYGLKFPIICIAYIIENKSFD